MIPFAIGLLVGSALIIVWIATAVVIQQRREKADRRCRKEERWARRMEERKEWVAQRLIEANPRKEFGSLESLKTRSCCC